MNTTLQYTTLYTIYTNYLQKYDSLINKRLKTMCTRDAYVPLLILSMDNVLKKIYKGKDMSGYEPGRLRPQSGGVLPLSYTSFVPSL